MSWLELKCYLIEILSFIKILFKTGQKVWNPHFYVEKETYPRMKIWVTDKGFRTFDGDYSHYPGEHLEENVTLHGMECKRCGKKMMEWDNGNVYVIPKQ